MTYQQNYDSQLSAHDSQLQFRFSEDFMHHPSNVYDRAPLLVKKKNHLYDPFKTQFGKNNNNHHKKNNPTILKQPENTKSVEGVDD